MGYLQATQRGQLSFIGWLNRPSSTMQAMLAVPGILSVEALGKGPWWKAPFTVRTPQETCASYVL